MELKEFLEKFCEIQKIDKKFFGTFNDVHSGLIQLDLFKNISQKPCKTSQIRFVKSKGKIV